MRLSDSKIRTLKPPDRVLKLSDGGGLYLHVTPKGAKLWRLAYRFEGKQKLLSFGPYPAVTLASARKKREEAKTVLAAGDDPSKKVQEEKYQQHLESISTFDAIANEVIEKDEREQKAPATITKKRWIIGLVKPDLGNRPITEIKAPEILAVLRKVEAAGNYETAKRMRSVIGQIFRYAIATSRAENDPTFSLRGALITPKVTHRASITDKNNFAGLVRAIWEYDGAIEVQAGLKLLALLYSRPGELRLAKWDEFDFERAIWTIPAARMKMRRQHKKPLPQLAIDILVELRNVTGESEFAFLSAWSKAKPLSENAFNGALRRLGFTKDEMTSHGFRSSASSILNESGKWSPDAIEAELAHIGADEVRRVYNRAQYWDERTEMSEWWAGEIQEMLGDAQLSNQDGITHDKENDQEGR
jgi:integrase